MLTMDLRYRLVTPFGKGVIRRFANNASQMKKLAGHHFEDLLQVQYAASFIDLARKLMFLQCALPVLDGLLPAPHNDSILDLVFVMGCWHAYAKLRLHTEHTLTAFESITADLGVLFRHFTRVTCEAFKTMELPRESAARLRRTANNPMAGASGGGARVKGFNLKTYKMHALGDYPKTIRERGTTDNYNSQRVRNHA